MDRKKHILVICTEKVSSVTVGVLLPLSQSEKNGLIETRFVRTAETTGTDIAWCDTLICVRGGEHWDLHIVRLCKQLGRQIVYFLDDDLLDIPDNVSCAEYYRDGFIRDSIKSLIEECDILWCVNPNIAEKYGKAFSRTILADPCIQPNSQIECKNGDVVRFIYAGGIDHQHIVEEKLTPVTKLICDEFGDRVHFTFIGVNPQLPEYTQVSYTPYINDYSEYRRIVRETQYDISFAPVYDTSFYHCKYYNKFLEYTSVGAVGIYSNTQPYTFIVTNYENGILADSEDEWVNAVRFLINNPSKREEMLENATNTLNNRFVPEKAGQKLIDIFPELYLFSAEQVQPKSININRFHLICIYAYQRLKMYFRRRGVLGLFLLPVKLIKLIVIKCQRKK